MLPFLVTAVRDRVVLYDSPGFRGLRRIVRCDHATLGNFNDRTASARVLGL